MTFFDMSLEEIESFEPIYFEAKTPVEFCCVDIKEHTESKSLSVNTKVLTGEHAGKDFKFNISGKDKAKAKETKAAFLLAFWTKEELKAGTATPTKLIGTKFQVTPDVPYEYDGKSYQTFRNWVPLKATEAIDVTATPF